MPRHALPPPSHLQQLAAALPPPAASSAAVAARGLCASPGPTLHLTLLPDEPAQQAAVDLAALADGLLQPALARLTGAAAIGSSVALLPPPLPASDLQWVEQRQAYVLPSPAAASWARQMQQVAWEPGGSTQQERAGRVLIYVPPHAQQPLLLERPGGSGEAGTSLQLSSSSLLLVANQNVASGGGSSGGSQLEAELAQRILLWLLQPLPAASTTDGGTAANATVSQLQRSLAAACAADATTALQQVSAAAAAAREQPVTAGMAAKAAKAAQLLQLVAGTAGGEQAPGAQLAAARHAWALAKQLLSDPESGARPAFPPEHAMAVLLPLSLPVTLVLVQAVGRQASAWKKQRQGGRRQQQGGEQPAGWQDKQAGADAPSGSKLD